VKSLSPALVTGASGFVGGHLVETLVRQNVKVKLLVRASSKLAFKPTANMELCYGDVTDLESLRKAMKGVQVVYHLAGVLRGSDFSSYRNVNAEGTRKVCRAAAESKVKRLVYVSSLSAAGPSTEKGPIAETDFPKPVSFYGQTKLMGEDIALSYQTHFPVTVLRPGAVYGPRETDIFEYFKMVASGIVVIGGADTQKISFVYVNDLVDAILLAAYSKKAEGKTYFVSDGQSYHWSDITVYIGKALNKSYVTIKLPLGLAKVVASIGDFITSLTGKSVLPPIVSSDKMKEAQVPGWACKNDKLRQELGFKPKVGIEAGIQKTVEAYRKAGWLR
jgi:nucleoside-diphosphate-sugar epimerase